MRMTVGLLRNTLLTILLVLGLGWMVITALFARGEVPEDMMWLLKLKVLSLQHQASQQQESAVSIPSFTPAVEPEAEIGPSMHKEVYFGDTHVHTALSFDSYLFGNRLGLREAYRFAQGEPHRLVTGEEIQLSRPLDFVVMADHAESFGLFLTCSRDDLTASQIEYCNILHTPKAESFLKIRRDAEQRPPRRMPGLCDGENLASCLDDAKSTWSEVRRTADEFNQPGEFTTFAGYEYSPPLQQRGKLHRNVIFNGSDLPEHAVSAYEADTVLDLWRTLEQSCRGECDFLTIPHNMNKSWGLAYSGYTIDGEPYAASDWELRSRREPLAEIFQIKGNSECGLGVGANDEECSFEQVLPVCEESFDPQQQTIGCSSAASFAREGLKIGLELEESLGLNPLKFGFIASTDTHNGNAGDTEEYDYRGSVALFDSPARSRLDFNDAEQRHGSSRSVIQNPGGLAAVWATENTRDALFRGMKERETYATSGTRIKLRFFAGWGFEQDLLQGTQLVEKAYQGGVPMGGTLSPLGEAASPEFLVWAVKDSNSNNLQQIGRAHV